MPAEGLGWTAARDGLLAMLQRSAAVRGRSDVRPREAVENPPASLRFAPPGLVSCHSPTQAARSGEILRAMVFYGRERG